MTPKTEPNLEMALKEQPISLSEEEMQELDFDFYPDVADL